MCGTNYKELNMLCDHSQREICLKSLVVGEVSAQQAFAARGVTLHMHNQLINCSICSAGAVVGLEQTFFRVMEYVGVVELCANVSYPDCTCPIAFPFDIFLSTDDGSAGKCQFKHNRSTFSVTFPTESTMDYGPLNELLMFYACETRKCVNVTVIDDVVDELDEFFTYHLRRTTSLDTRIELDPVDGRIEIVDNDGE